MATSRVATGNDDYTGNVYVFEVPVRIWHWIHALAITTLAITGYLIANPLPSMGGDPPLLPAETDRGARRRGHQPISDRT